MEESDHSCVSVGSQGTYSKCALMAASLTPGLRSFSLLTQGVGKLTNEEKLLSRISLD